jgi:hypothetical protein
MGEDSNIRNADVIRAGPQNIVINRLLFYKIIIRL